MRPIAVRPIATRPIAVRPIWITGLLLALVVLASTNAAYAATGTVVPAVGTPRTLFTFTAGGFGAGERVVFWVNTPDGRVIGNAEDYVTGATRNGTATWVWRAPVNARNGEHTMVAQGRTTGTTATISFTVTGGQPVAPPSGAAGAPQVSPTSGVPGTLFTFSARGFVDSETITFWLNAPDGTVVTDTTYTGRASAGQAAWTWQSSLNTLPGAWQMVVRGDRSGAQVVIPFTVE